MNSADDTSFERLSALSSHLFLIAVLVPADGREDQEQLNILLHSKLTVGRTVSSLYTLRDLDGTEGAFFVFSDISVRAEGNYKLRMCLFDIREHTVNYNLSVLTEPFTVYSAKTFPGMYRSCPLVQNFAKQGLKIRIRKESGPRPSRYVHSKRKTIRKAIHSSDTDDPMMGKNKPIVPKPRTITTKSASTATAAAADSEEDEEEDEYELDEDDDDDVESHQQQPIENNRKVTHINHLLSHPVIKSTIDAQLSIDGHHPNISAFKRVNTETESTVSTKRRLSLSYLLDQNENLPQHTTASPLVSEDCRLAPISIIQHTGKPSYSAYGQDVKPADNLPPIQHPFNSSKVLPYKQEDLPPIQKQLQYIDKR
ncbi:velvet factor-domain-containing protein [Mucor lusitanicus]|uniref:Velvet factor-domain-containing protein n=1 Tax=Mucor circinelloides f. lusitanicus TaxID=29924 RepID=A0A8H4F0T3_MUCCL|nr:velvet factor-domain-containing protein [Mucor lusitanicus]